MSFYKCEVTAQPETHRSHDARLSHAPTQVTAQPETHRSHDARLSHASTQVTAQPEAHRSHDARLSHTSTQNSLKKMAVDKINGHVMGCTPQKMAMCCGAHHSSDWQRRHTQDNWHSPLGTDDLLVWQQLHSQILQYPH